MIQVPAEEYTDTIGLGNGEEQLTMQWFRVTLKEKSGEERKTTSQTRCSRRAFKRFGLCPPAPLGPGSGLRGHRREGARFT